MPPAETLPLDATPQIIVTPRALAELASAAESEGGTVRLEIDRHFQYGLGFDEPRPGDVQLPLAGVTLLLDRITAGRAEGTTIDFVEREGAGRGFKITNPNEPPRVRSMSVTELKDKLGRGEPLLLIDVRGESERAIASLDAAQGLSAELDAQLRDADREQTLVFMCHTGMRSYHAAQHYLSRGFKNVFNLEGGVDAWSVLIDPSIPRY